MGIGISPTWTFKEVVNNIKTIKLQYEEVLSSFSNFEGNKRNEYKRSVRDTVYSLQMAEWKKDRIWEYMNDCQALAVLKQICERDK